MFVTGVTKELDNDSNGGILGRCPSGCRGLPCAAHRDKGTRDERQYHCYHLTFTLPAYLY